MHTRDITSGRAQVAKIVAITAFTCGIVAALPSVGWAQQASHTSQLDARWQPWIGCWKPAPPEGAAISLRTEPRSSNAPLVCVIPSTGAEASSGVDVVTIAIGKIVARDTINANGQSVARSKDGCNGVESANWSADGRRVYVSSDFTCPGGLKRTSSGLFAMSPTGEWVNVQSVNASGSKGVRTVHYTDAGIPNGVPSEVSQALDDGALAVSTARAAAGQPLNTADIVEASRKVDPTVVEAWIIDRRQGFGVDAKQIVALADAGVPSNITDAMVALSYPKAFAVNLPDGSAVGATETVPNASGADVERANGRNVEVLMMPAYSPYDYSPFGYSPYGYAPYGYYGGYGYSAYGYSPYGAYYSPYAGYGAAYGGWYGNGPPIIVLKGSQSTQSQGYAVRGRGYTQGAPGGYSSGSTAQPRPSGSAGTRAPSTPSQPSSSGRTAHQRP